MSDDAKKDRTSEATEVGRWRVGRSLGRTIYYDDLLIGMVDTEAAAKRIVEAMNGMPDCSGEYRRGLRQGRLVGLLDAVTSCSKVREAFPGGLNERWVGANACLTALATLIEEAKRVTNSPPVQSAWDAALLASGKGVSQHARELADPRPSDAPPKPSLVARLRGELFQRAVRSEGYSMRCLLCLSSWSGGKEKHADGCLLGDAHASLSTDYPKRIEELESALRQIATYVNPDASDHDDFLSVQHIAEDALESAQKRSEG